MRFSDLLFFTVVLSTAASHLNLGVLFPEIHIVISCEYAILPVLDSCVTLLVSIPCVSKVTAF